MDYLKIYNLIINNAKKETIEGLRPKTKNRKYIEKYAKNFKHSYFEMHHIKPRSLFPELAKNKDNIVALTAREHFFCHQLLIKICPTKEMNLALFYLINGKNNKYYKLSSKEYEKLRQNCNFASTKGYKLYNDGIKEKFFKENKQPKNFKLGKLKKHKINSGTFRKGLTPKNKAKKCYNDGKNNYYFSENETIPSLLKEGMAPQKFSKKRSLSQKGRKCATKGMKHFTDGLKDTMAYECPEGFKLGRPNPEKYVTTLGFKWWNNGLSEKLCKEKPDSNWTLGRIKKCQK